MKQLNWISENEFVLEGVKFVSSPKDYSLKTTEDSLVILKDRDILDKYIEVFGQSEIKNVFEFGIFQGGSPALFTLWLDLNRFVGVDISAPIPVFDSFCAGSKASGRIRTYYGVSQADAARIKEIIENEFNAEPIDLIIDDASHHYSPTRTSFEISFPFLKPGGYYVIEDWAWAHWPAMSLYRGHTALTKLIFEITMLCASRRDLIEEVRILPWFVVIKKAALAPSMPRFDIDELIYKRGVEISGTKDLNLVGVAKLLLSRMLRR